MLHAFKDHLKKLSSDPTDPFCSQVRKRVGKRGASVLEKRLRDMILLTPDVISRIYALWAHRKSSAKIKRLGGFLLAYLYQTDDFLPSDRHGLFGYLDDTYFVALVYEKVVEELGQGASALLVTAKEKALLEKVLKFKKSARIVIPNETREMEKMFQGLLREQTAAFTEAFKA